jgi:UDP-N-acetylmuramate dehydrogenase
VSRRHANFFVAREGATAADLHRLVVEVRRRVREATGLELVTEVRFVGRFDE